MAKISHFEFSSDNPGKSAKFFENVFGWKFKKLEGFENYWLIDLGDTPSTNMDAGLAKRKDGDGKIIITFEVPDVQATVDKIRENGGKITSPIHPIPDIGWLAYCADLDETEWGIIQLDQNAK